ncbi:MAG TPA: phosphonate ABC transporter, permease protein PhnE [Chloroflexia bacterium]|nr:phosphonate ABC transporter, permease protein PhnE [Chloroflexia bacterium]
MATVDRPITQPRATETQGRPDSTAEPSVRPPKPFFLRSWFALVLTALIVAAHVYGWQKSEIQPGLLVEKAPRIANFVGQVLQPDIIGYDRAGFRSLGLQVAGYADPPENAQPMTVQEEIQAGNISTINTETSGPDLTTGVVTPIVPADTTGTGTGSLGGTTLDPSATQSAVGDTITPTGEKYKVELKTSADKVVPGQKINVSGSGLRPNTEGHILWRSTGLNASAQPLGTFISDNTGAFKMDVQVPNDPDRVVATASYSPPNTIEINQSWNVGSAHFTDTFWTVLDKVIETIFLALMGTTFAVILSIPLSFLASRNLMAHNLVGTSVYMAARTILNILRSIEVLILAVIFGATVGLGPFAGVLALSLHSIASLGKLYSEAIESIDPGPIEAISATGANRLQMIVYAVVPQFIPQFISFTLYRWDINVRMSTVLGFVGGGGVGYILNQFIGLLQWNKAGTAILFIAIVVIAMDYASSKIRAAVI